MIFVSAIPSSMIELPPGPRLFAYPQAPRPDGMTILDSGAYGLSKRGGKMTQHYMRGLADFYEKHYDESVYCIAPDVYLDPRQTMANFSWWADNVGFRVCPVIQFNKERKISVISAIEQAKFYAKFRPALVAVSNPGMRASESELMPVVCGMVREITGASWLHNLGAGWSPDDVFGWSELGCFDSIDTIAYYTDAQAGKLWRRDKKIERSDCNWHELALKNSESASEICRKTKAR